MEKKRTSHTATPAKAAAGNTRRKATSRKANKKRKGPRAMKVIGIIAAILVAVAAWACLPLAESDVVIRLPYGASASQRDSIMDKALGASHAGKVRMLASLTGKDFSRHPMMFSVKKGTPVPLTLVRMIRASRTPVKVVVNGWRTRGDIIDNLADATGVPPELYDSVLTSAEWLDDFQLTQANADAMFLNYTHEVFYGADPRSTLDKIGDAYMRFWTADRREKARKLGLAPADAVILASIVEEESNVRDERGRIGRLYLNRLAKNMRLQADPTVKFALGDFTIKRITNDMLAIESPYNTYRNAGLPPGPIRTVDPATIDAILNSAPSDDIYMCASPDFSGRHNFASTYQEHLRNAAAYRSALDERNIK